MNMAVVTINASGAGAAGLDVNAYLAAFTANFGAAGTNFGFFADAVSPYEQYAIDGGNAAANDAMLVGGAITYDQVTRIAAGSVNTLSFGATSSAGFGNGFVAGPLSLTGTILALSNLGAVGSGAGNIVHNIIYGLAGGAETALVNYLFSTAGNSFNFIGSTGNDSITSSIGNDTVAGGSGVDTVAFTYATAAVTASTTGATGGAGTDTFSSVENLTGSAFNDSLTGSTAVNVLNGAAGNDTISAGSGNDVLNGGAGVDSLVGGAGADDFVYNAASESTAAAFDTVNGFAANASDQFDLRGLALTGSYSGTTASANGVWTSGTGATRMVYADTNGDAAADLVVRVLNFSGTFDASDFILV
jgi:Ca2+-binding RTX toxin-like protein